MTAATARTASRSAIMRGISAPSVVVAECTVFGRQSREHVLASSRAPRYIQTMQRPASWFALFAGALILSGAARADDVLHSAQSASVFGPLNPLLTQGTEALQAGRYEEGVRLTIQGLDQPNSARDKAAAHSNICAGYVALKRWEEALEHCNLALDLDRNNWRT